MKLTISGRESGRHTGTDGHLVVVGDGDGGVILSRPLAGVVVILGVGHLIRRLLVRVPGEWTRRLAEVKGICTRKKGI